VKLEREGAGGRGGGGALETKTGRGRTIRGLPLGNQKNAKRLSPNRREGRCSKT